MRGSGKPPRSFDCFLEPLEAFERLEHMWRRFLRPAARFQHPMWIVLSISSTSFKRHSKIVAFGWRRKRRSVGEWRREGQIL
jgi:hypothetical protein